VDHEAVDPGQLPGVFVQPGSVTPEEIAAYETALTAASNERAMQRFLEANPRLLTQHLGASPGRWVIPQKQLGAEHVTDFLIAEIGSTGFVWYAVELERPQAKLFTKKRDPSAALTHAMRQISDWRNWLSHNRDYAMRSPEQFGLGLVGIDPELEGLIIMGRDADIDPYTNPLRQRLARDNRIRIETYDWLSHQNPITESLVRRAARKVFGSFVTYWWEVATRATRAESVLFEFGSASDSYEVPINFVDEDTGWGPISLYDWLGWINYVDRDIGVNYSLLVSERPPDEQLREKLAEKREGIWYVPLWFRRKDVVWFNRVDVLAYLPPSCEQSERIARLSIARELLLDYLPEPRADHVPDERHVKLHPFQQTLFDHPLESTEDAEEFPAP
jgi:hypothetical protein